MSALGEIVAGIFEGLLTFLGRRGTNRKPGTDVKPITRDELHAAAEHSDNVRIIQKDGTVKGG